MLYTHFRSNLVVDILFFVTLTVLLTSCNTLGSKENELSRVAKDWCLLIRASQVIPVYPLTEDIQPGDIFLVQKTIADQVKIYQSKGFLPLDNLLARINPNGYQNFYENSFQFGGNKKPLPKYGLGIGKDSKVLVSLPQAAFPNYTFSVKRGSGFNLALPVSGVPIGLGLLDADTATGTIQIDDARTYGVDTLSMFRQIKDFWDNNIDLYSMYASQGDDVNYVRVITRVYLVGKLNISMQDSSSFSAGVTGGAPKPLELLTVNSDKSTTISTTQNYKDNLGKLNKTLEGVTQLPGASLKIMSASAHSISLVQTFSRPLVIGYLGFDMPITELGELGAPIPTYSVMTGNARRPISLAGFSTSQKSTKSNIEKLLDRPDDNFDKSIKKVLEKIGGDFVKLYEQRSTKIKAKDFTRNLLGVYLSSAEYDLETRRKILIKAIESEL